MHTESKSEQLAIVWAHRACGGWGKNEGDGVGSRSVFLLEFAQRLMLGSDGETQWISEGDAKKIFSIPPGPIGLPKKELDAALRRLIRWWEKESDGDDEPAWITSMRDAKRTIEKPLLFFCHVSSMGAYYGNAGLFSAQSEQLCCARWRSAASEMLLKRNVVPMVDALPKSHLSTAAWIAFESAGPTHHQCVRFRRQFRRMMDSKRDISIEDLPLPWTLSDEP